MTQSCANAGMREFAAFLQTPSSKRTIDLSEASLVQCVEEKIRFKQRLHPRYHKQYFSLVKALKELEELSKCKFKPLKVDAEFWTRFYTYLVYNKKKVSTIKTLFAQLKCSLEWCSRYGAEIADTYNEFEVPAYQVQQIALTPDDISRIYHFDIDALPRRPQIKATFKKVRDMFCLMANVGLRYSDARRLTKDHFHDGVIEILQQKTKRLAQIDVNNFCIHRRMVHEILERYGYSAPYAHDLTEFDKRLHELMVAIGYNQEQVAQETVENGEVTVQYKSKSELITSHTGRRTFVVYNALRGKSMLEIMRCTGHKTVSALQKYLCYY